MGHGIPITKEEAQKLMDQQQGIVEYNRHILSKDCESRGQKEAGVYYPAKGSETKAANCFIFDIEHFTKFKDNGATQILAILGANESGKPTILMVGCTAVGSGTNVYKSLDALADEPAVQHPPVIVQPTLPIEGTGLIFTSSPDE